MTKYPLPAGSSLEPYEELHSLFLSSLARAVPRVAQEVSISWKGRRRWGGLFYSPLPGHRESTPSSSGPGRGAASRFRWLADAFEAQLDPLRPPSPLARSPATEPRTVGWRQRRGTCNNSKRSKTPWAYVSSRKGEISGERHTEQCRPLQTFELQNRFRRRRAWNYFPRPSIIFSILQGSKPLCNFFLYNCVPPLINTTG